MKATSRCRTLGSLRWGVSDKSEFCVTLQREHWNWQVCTPNNSDQREAVLAMARGYTRAFPKDHVIACENTGC